MNKKHKVLAVIPARSGSKGVPRKNLRILHDKPLICHSIDKLLNNKDIDKVVVTTDCDEIENISKIRGAQVIKRPKKLSLDEVPLDPVIKHARDFLKDNGEVYDLILTVQATCPLIKNCSISKAIKKFDNTDINSIISITDDTHLRWKTKNKKIIPDFKERLNRQQLQKIYRESGGIIAVRDNCFIDTRLVEPYEVIELDEKESLDIDTPEHLIWANSLLKQKKIAIWPCATLKKGMGHIYRQTLVADHLVSHDITFFLKEEDDIGIEQLKKTFYNLQVYKNSEAIKKSIIDQGFSSIIIDILDTSKELISFFKEKNINVITFEDLGTGSSVSDLTINALYSSKGNNKNSSIFYGTDYFVMRPEFFLIRDIIKEKHSHHIITLIFGGSDPANITLKALKDLSKSINLHVNVVIGPANKNAKKIKSYLASKNINFNYSIHHNSNELSNIIKQSYLVICSGGQTLYESISLKIPAIVVTQNKRELTHGLLTDNFRGLVNLGFFDELKQGAIHDALKKIIDDKNIYNDLVHNCETIDLLGGTKRVVGLLNNFIERGIHEN